MSRFVRKRHGLTISSDNVYYITGDGELRSGFRAIVSARGFQCDKFEMLNSSLWTPAQQIMWERDEAEEVVEVVEGQQHTRPLPPYILRQYWYYWLTENVGDRGTMWDVRSRNNTRAEPIFFKRRSDALKFCARIDGLLKGLKFSEY